MKKRYVVNLTEEERAALTELTRRSRVSGLKRQRAQILLKADDGLTDQEIADELEVGLVTVERVRKRCVERGIAGTLDRKPQEMPSRPRKFDGASEAKLVQCARCPTERTRPACFSPATARCNSRGVAPTSAASMAIVSPGLLHNAR